LQATLESVTSALKRARAAVNRRMESSAAQEPPPAAHSPEEADLVARLTHAYETGDVDGLIALLTDDVWVAMPPVPLEYQGIELARRFHTEVTFRHGRRWHMVPTRANGQPAFGAYLKDPTGGPSHAIGLLTFTFAGDRISAITRFDTSVLPAFGLPRTLPS
jgi:RNA polymerase sigma-70 factor (ECF subfamily)